VRAKTKRGSSAPRQGMAAAVAPPPPAPTPAPVAPTWSWPPYCVSAQQLLSVLRQGFELITTFTGHFKDRPIYTLRRDGIVVPNRCMSQAAGRIVATKYCELPVELPDGNLIHRFKTT
jgi:hypothetical protein